jgi:gamma-glutamylcyclotransferase (GGCT)/AIG2-like uncharacterized protein YtfP
MTDTAITYQPTFVYGTLRPGGGNHHLWRDQAVARYDNRCFVVGYALVHNGHFPYLIPAATSQSVGTLIYPDADSYLDVLEDMDRLEGVPHHYERITVPVMLRHGITSAWTYTAVRAQDSYISNLPDVATDDRGFHNWRLHMRSHRWT